MLPPREQHLIYGHFEIIGTKYLFSHTQTFALAGCFFEVSEDNLYKGDPVSTLWGSVAAIQLGTNASLMIHLPHLPWSSPPREIPFKILAVGKVLKY